jgi:uncharacterized protein
MIEWLMQPLPWWLSGILIGLTVPLLFWLSGQAFGISSSLEHIGAACTPESLKPAYLKERVPQSYLWNLVFVAGITLGGAVAANFLSSAPIQFLPDTYHSTEGMIRLAIGGVLVGFGTRYAGGCTSGHAITGISNLNVPSMIATAFFFVGGLIVTWGLGSLLLGL